MESHELTANVVYWDRTSKSGLETTQGKVLQADMVKGEGRRTLAGTSVDTLLTKRCNDDIMSLPCVREDHTQ